MTEHTYEPMLDQLQRAAFAYFLDQTNPTNGLVKDCTRPGFPASIAAVGFALAAYPIGVERGIPHSRRGGWPNADDAAVLLQQHPRSRAGCYGLSGLLLPFS